MPIYCYRCEACGHEVEEYQSIHDVAFLRCPKCAATEVYGRIPTLPHTDIKEFQTPIEMYSIAMNSDEEIRGFAARCPGVDVSADPEDPLYGIPVARTRQQKLHALKAMGCTEAK